MRRSGRIDVFCYLIVTILVLPILGRAESDDKAHPRKCDISELGREQCGKNERCRAYSSDQPGVCQCQLEYDLINGECVRVTTTAASVDVTTLKPELKPESEGSSVAAGLLIPTFLVVIGGLLYFGARRYKWLQRFRQYRHNRYGNVLVTRDDDDDDDDPPIA